MLFLALISSIYHFSSDIEPYTSHWCGGCLEPALSVHLLGGHSIMLFHLRALWLQCRHSHHPPPFSHLSLPYTHLLKSLCHDMYGMSKRHKWEVTIPPAICLSTYLPLTGRLLMHSPPLSFVGMTWHGVVGGWGRQGQGRQAGLVEAGKSSSRWRRRGGMACNRLMPPHHPLILSLSPLWILGSVREGGVSRGKAGWAGGGMASKGSSCGIIRQGSLSLSLCPSLSLLLFD